MKLRRIDFENEKHFTCDGKEFFIIDDPGFIRYREMQKLMIEFAYSATFQDIFNNITKAIDSYNKHQYFDMSIILYKIQEGIKNLEEKDDPALRLCTLFIIEKDEDLTVCNEAMMRAKIDCWARELEVGPFLTLASALVPGWMPAYQLTIQSGLTEKVEKES